MKARIPGEPADDVLQEGDDHFGPDAFKAVHTAEVADGRVLRVGTAQRGAQDGQLRAARHIDSPYFARVQVWAAALDQLFEPLQFRQGPVGVGRHGGRRHAAVMSGHYAGTLYRPLPAPAP